MAAQVGQLDASLGLLFEGEALAFRGVGVWGNVGEGGELGFVGGEVGGLSFVVFRVNVG